MLLILISYTFLLNFLIKKISATKRHRQMYAAYITMFLLPPLLFLAILSADGIFEQAGMGARVMGLIFALITFMNGLIVLLITLYSKKPSFK